MLKFQYAIASATIQYSKPRRYIIAFSLREVAQWLTRWHSGPEVLGSRPATAIILLGSN